ncbi:MAG: rhodanese-like domain-containing protein [Pseudomonadota bacterium]|nr:MAG: rhodanese-like domain-containing protein [Pseudomonadota bacterium]
MTRNSVVFLIGVLLLVFSSAQVALAKDESEFPGRKLYPAVKYIELDDLQKQFNNVVVVDVRSSYEYQTLRIKGAVNIPLASKEFVADMKALRARDARQIVVYCNGKTCMKSYKAATKCRTHNIADVVSFDRGIMDWAQANPDRAVLLGRSPVDPGRLISKSTFKKRLVDPMKFEEQVATGKAVVVDVRDRFQREAVGLFTGLEGRGYIDDPSTLDKYIAKAKAQNKPMYVYDAAGKQVRWLMYYLEDQKVSEYYFMKGGARAYYNAIRAQYVR